jgi:hypothetical protein
MLLIYYRYKSHKDKNYEASSQEIIFGKLLLLPHNKENLKDNRRKKNTNNQNRSFDENIK